MKSNRLALFAHFDAEDQVKRYVTEYLAHLGSVCDRTVFVSTSRLSEGELDKVRPHVESVLLKDNTGYDFGMWQHALERTDLRGVDELVLTNSSMLGPIHPLGPVFRRMAEDPCDFWGMTDNFEYRWHLQSYFLVFKRQVLESEAFREFFWSVLPYKSKGPVVLGYEVGLTSFLVDSGFRPGAFLPVESWATWLELRRMDLERRWNPTLFYPTKLLSLGMPFVKLMLLRDNPGNVPLDPVYRAMAAAGYDLGLIELDRAPKPPELGWRGRMRRIWSRIAVVSDKTSALSLPRRSGAIIAR
jgi:lipopolysaccharide biosynthesis protein